MLQSWGRSYVLVTTRGSDEHTDAHLYVHHEHETLTPTPHTHPHKWYPPSTVLHIHTHWAHPPTLGHTLSHFAYTHQFNHKMCPSTHQLPAVSPASPCHQGPWHPPCAHLAWPFFGRADHYSQVHAVSHRPGTARGHPTCTATQLSPSEQPSATTLSTHGPDCTCDSA